MRTTDILKQLADYLPPVTVTELQLSIAVPGSIQLCLSIADIVRTYNDTQDREDRVSYLLSALCKNHFKVTTKN